MTSPLILFNRSSADRLAGLPPMSVTGTLPGYNFDVAYVGRLQINNAVGDCTVEVLPDSQLPDGYSVWVDNATHEVVVQFPAYTPAPVYVPVQNGDLELGSAGVLRGAGWEIGQFGVTTNGSWSARYMGGGQASILWPRAKVNPGDTITATIDLNHGPGDKGSVGGSVVLYFYDASGKLIQDSPGPGGGTWSRNGWITSSVTATAPAASKTVSAGASATRFRQNKPFYVDNARWNLVTTAGISSTQDLFVHVRVRDSAGRSADWSGWIYGSDTYYATNPIAGAWPWKLRANTNFIIGAAQEVAGAYTNNQGWWHGYIDSFRITKGVARYAVDSYPVPTSDFGDATSDPYYSNVVLLLRMNGANGSTSFVDEKGHAVTANGGAAISTTQSRFGGSSMYCDGVGTYLSVEMGPDADLGPGAWTMDAWVWMQDTANVPAQYNRAIFGYGPLSTSANDSVWFCPGNTWVYTQLETGNANQPSIVQNLAPYAQVGRFAFVSICWDGTSYWLHQDGKCIAGTQVLTYTSILRDYVDETGNVYVDEDSNTYQG